MKTPYCFRKIILIIIIFLLSGRIIFFDSSFAECLRVPLGDYGEMRQLLRTRPVAESRSPVMLINFRNVSVNTFYNGVIPVGHIGHEIISGVISDDERLDMLSERTYGKVRRFLEHCILDSWRRSFVPILVENHHTPSLPMHEALKRLLGDEPWILDMDDHLDARVADRYMGADNLWSEGILRGIVNPKRLIMVGPKPITNFMNVFIIQYNKDTKGGFGDLMKNIPDISSITDERDFRRALDNSGLNISTDLIDIICDSYMEQLVLFKSGVTFGCYTPDNKLIFMRMGDNGEIQQFDADTFSREISGKPIWFSFDTDVCWPESSRSLLIEIAALISKGNILGVHVSELRVGLDNSYVKNRLGASMVWRIIQSAIGQNKQFPSRAVQMAI